MATTLPAINQPASKPLGTVLATLGDKASMKSKRTTPTSVFVRPKLNKKEQELQEQRLAARAKLPDLTEWQTDE